VEVFSGVVTAALAGQSAAAHPGIQQGHCSLERQQAATLSLRRSYLTHFSLMRRNILTSVAIQRHCPGHADFLLRNVR
jgi:hypothetical protein